VSQTRPTNAEVTCLAAEFVIHGSQVKAWRKTYPTSKAKKDTKHQKASVVFSLAKVKKRIEQLEKLSKTNSEEEFTMSVSQIKKVLATAIQKGIKDKIDAQGNHIAHNLSAAVSAASELNRMDGNHAPAKTDLTINPNDMCPWDDVSARVDKHEQPFPENETEE